MSKFCAAHRPPRAGIDPIVDPADALAVIRLAVSSPPLEETVVLLLDADRRGRTVVVVDGTDDDDAVVEIVERLAETMGGGGAGDSVPGALVVATVRIGRGPDAEDADRWLDATDAAESFGLELVEWFVIEAHEGQPPERFTAWCPRDLLAEPPRWRPS